MKINSSERHSQIDRSYLDSNQSELPDKTYRRSILQLLIVITAFFSLLFCVFNWQDSRLMAIYELCLGIYSMLLYPFSRQEKRQYQVSLFFIIPLYSMFMFALLIAKEAETAFVWILVIPVLSHFLLGRWYGLWISVAYLLMAALLITTRALISEVSLDALVMSNLALAALAVLVFSHVYEVSRVRAHKKLLRLATTDHLTSLANRARFLDVFERERNHAARNRTELSLLLLDLDHFKQVNDRFGHDVGDEVLKYVSATIAHRLRKTDLACRLGGEEFGVLLPGANLDRAIAIAEIIRRNIADIPYAKGDQVIPLTVSIGAAEYGYDGRDLESMYAIADGHMYKAKASGRNQVRHRMAMRNCELDLTLAD
jgi:diguanylate cyclase (GGDEF)-like protein